MKRRGNRRYYQHHEVLLIRRIRDLLYEQGFTISGARNRLTDGGPGAKLVGESDVQGLVAGAEIAADISADAIDLDEMIEELQAHSDGHDAIPQPEVATVALSLPQMRQELISIRGLLMV